MADEGGLVALEERISSLEKRTFSTKPVQLKSSCSDALVEVNEEINKISSDYTKIGALWKRLNELQGYLSAEFLQKLVLTDDTKADIIIADEKQLRASAERFEILEKLKNIPSEATFKELPTWIAKIDPLIQINLNQMQNTEELDEKVCHLLTTYNDIISNLSKQFQEWDKYISSLEETQNQ